MGKAGRFACILTPMVLSLASLICLLVVFLAGTNKSDSNLRSLYYFSADTSAFKANTTLITNFATGIKGVDDKTKKLIEALIGQVQAKNLKDVYYIYPWNYCSGSKNGIVNGSVTIDFCSNRKAQYYFNPIVEWGLNGTATQQYIPGGVDSALKAYQKGAQWMFIAYATAFWTTVATIVVGLFALCSRIGSCFTTIVSGVATLFTILAAVTSTILFSTLVGALSATLKPYQIKLSVGTKMMALDWLAVAFSIGASMFWLVTICCCSGKSSRKDRKVATPASVKAFGSRGSAAYQPLGDEHNQSGNPYHSQYGAPQGHRGMEMHEYGQTGAGPYKGRETAYEPFRHA